MGRDLSSKGDGRREARLPEPGDREAAGAPDSAHHARRPVARRWRHGAKESGQGRTRTADTGLFRAVLYQLSYLTILLRSQIFA